MTTTIVAPAVNRTKPPKNIGIIAARGKSEARELGKTISDWLSEHERHPISERALGNKGPDEVDAIVALGGDGLMMRAANQHPDIPLLGINFGKVGFLALIEQQDWRVALQALIEGEFKIEKSSTLQSDHVRDEQPHDTGWAINDVVIRSGNRMIDLELYIDGYYVNTYPGDGMIVSTARGSTAYCMAAGGPILTAGVRGFALVPISCHSPIRTPLVAAETAVIELVLANDHAASLILDGREDESLQKGDLIRVTRGEHTFQLVTIGSTNFYDAVRTKFNFQIRPDAIPSLGLRNHAERR